MGPKDPAGFSAAALGSGTSTSRIFARDFQTIVGKPPAGYARSAARPC